MKTAFRAVLLIASLSALAISGCSQKRSQRPAEINPAASLAGNSAAALQVNPLSWQIITSEINHADSTMATLYGNDVAVRYARSHHVQHDYPADAVISLVTWTQKEDPRWFGARIPDRVKSVEFVFARATANGQIEYFFQKYEGNPLQLESSMESSTQKNRANYLISRRAAVLP